MGRAFWDEEAPSTKALSSNELGMSRTQEVGRLELSEQEEGAGNAGSARLDGRLQEVCSREMLWSDHCAKTGAAAAGSYTLLYFIFLQPHEPSPDGALGSALLCHWKLLYNKEFGYFVSGREINFLNFS